MGRSRGKKRGWIYMYLMVGYLEVAHLLLVARLMLMGHLMAAREFLV